MAGVARDQDTTTADKINSARTLLTECVSIPRLPSGDDPGTFDAARDLFEETYQLASETGVDIIVLRSLPASVSPFRGAGPAST